MALADGRAESPLETRGRLHIVGSGLPAPSLQVEIRTPGRLVAVVDAWFDDAAASPAVVEPNAVVVATTGPTGPSAPTTSRRQLWMCRGAGVPTW